MLVIKTEDPALLARNYELLGSYKKNRMSLWNVMISHQAIDGTLCLTTSTQELQQVYAACGGPAGRLSRTTHTEEEIILVQQVYLTELSALCLNPGSYTRRWCIQLE